MGNYNHSVLLDIEKCKGCTNCLKRCPTEAIRIRDGHAQINSNRCIDCGECIRICPYKAKKAVSDKIERLQDFKYKIALPAPSLYGQFDNLDDIDYLLQGLLDYGFDEVFEVARAAEIVSGYTRRYLKMPGLAKPVISSACPVVSRLIALRYPFLIDNVMPLKPPVDIAAQLAREGAMKAHPELKSEDIGVCFISPCPAKVSYLKSEKEAGRGNVDCIVSASDIYFAIVNKMERKQVPIPVSKTGMIGVSWAASGGEASALFNDRYLAADGIENVIKVLDNIDNGTLPNLEFVELDACTGGCVGGVMNVANPFIAKARLQSIRRYLPVSQNWDFFNSKDDDMVPDSFFSEGSIEYEPDDSLAGDMNEAFRKRAAIQEIADSLPQLDCGSCGAPTCMAFAEDIVRGEATEEECIVKMRDKIQQLLRGEHNDSK